jgi:hypothetical protein
MTTAQRDNQRTMFDAVLCILGPLEKRYFFTSQHKKSFPRLEVQARDKITNGWIKAAAEYSVRR